MTATALLFSATYSQMSLGFIRDINIMTLARNIRKCGVPSQNLFCGVVGGWRWRVEIVFVFAAPTGISVRYAIAASSVDKNKQHPTNDNISQLPIDIFSFLNLDAYLSHLFLLVSVYSTVLYFLSARRRLVYAY